MYLEHTMLTAAVDLHADEHLGCSSRYITHICSWHLAVRALKLYVACRSTAMAGMLQMV